MTVATPPQHAAETVPDVNGNTLFISYSRKDQAFVKTLDAAFKQLQLNPWVDWEDIRKGEDWRNAIWRGIEGANTFVFVLSPDSVASSVCREEIEYAAKCNKRFLPIVHREGFDMAQVHPQISSHNWLFFRETDNFEAAFQELHQAVTTDLDYVNAHTRLLVRAIEWQANGKNASFLLRGIVLEEARQWLIKSASKAPKPTELQTQYIHASHEAEVAKRQANAKARRKVILAIVFTNLVLSITGGIWFYQNRVHEAKERVEDKLQEALDIGIRGVSGDDFAALSHLTVAPGTLPVNNALYQTHQKWLLSIRSVFPDMFIRTYAKGRLGQTIWIGDVTRELPDRPRSTNFRYSFHARTIAFDVFQGQKTVDMAPHADPQDNLGSVISAFGPIRNRAGTIVGGMRVDYTQDYFIQQINKTRNQLLFAYAISLFWLCLLSWMILRTIRAMDDRLS